LRATYRLRGNLEKVIKNAKDEHFYTFLLRQFTIVNFLSSDEKQAIITTFVQQWACTLAVSRKATKT